MAHLPLTVVTAKLPEMFAPEASIVSYHVHLETGIRGSDESAEKFALELLNLAAKVYPGKDAKDCEEMVLHNFLNGQP